MMRGFAIHPRRIMSTKAFDVFLSYNSQDEPHVRSLYAALTSRGIQPWFDKEHLLPGDDWQTILEQAIKNACAFAVCISGHSLGPWQNQEVKAGINLAVEEKRRVIPVMLPGAPKKPKQPLFLGNWHQADLRTFAETELDRLVQGIKGRESPHDPPVPPTAPSAAASSNPFLFNCPATDPRFVGREKLCRRFLDDLSQGVSISLVGDARMGKSSLLERWQELAQQAGRVTRLFDGQGAAGENCAAFVAAITGQAADSAWNPDQAANVIESWIQVASPRQVPLVLVDEAERALVNLPERFFERLRGLVSHQRLYLVLASRRDIGEIRCHDHKTSPLANCMKRVQLELLDEAAAQQLCALGAGVLSAADIQLMRKQAGRHPFYLSLLGHYLWQARRDGDSESEALWEFKGNARRRLDEWWQVLSSKEQKQLAMVLEDNTPKPESNLNERGLLDQGQPFGEVVCWWWGERA